MEHSKKFYSSIGLLILLNAVIKPVWIFGIDRQVQNLTGTSTYGVYFSLVNLCFVFGFLLDWGITVFYNRESAADPSNYLRKAGSFLQLKLIFSICYGLVVAAIAWFTGVSNWHLLVLVMLVQVLTSFFVFLRSIVTAQQLFNTDAWLSVLDKLMMIVLAGSFLLFPLYTGYINIYRFLYLQVISTFAVILFTLFIPGVRTVLFGSVRFAFPQRSILLNAFPFAALVFLMSVHMRLDGFLLERLHPNGAYEAGIYAAAYRLLDAVNMPGYLVTAFLLPYIAKHFTADRNVETVLLNCRHLLSMFAVGVISVSFVLSPWIQQVLYHHDVTYGANVMRLTMASMIGYVLVQVYGTLLTAAGAVKNFVIINFIAVMMNVILNLLLIPRFGAMGCALAAICSQLTSGIALLLFASKRLSVAIHLRSVGIYIFTMMVLLTILKAGSDWELNKILLLVVAAIAAIIIMLVTDLFNFRKWKTVIQ